VMVRHTRARNTANLLQCTRKTLRISRELYGRCVRQIFALPGNRALDQAPEEDSKISHHQQRHANERNLSCTVVLARTTPSSTAVQQKPTCNGKQKDAEQQADQADVQPHVTVEYVAEFVRYHTLQLVASEVRDSAARYGHGSIVQGVACSECVDAALAIQHEHRRHRRA